MSTVDRSLRATKDRLLFLCGETQMTPRDIRLNTDAFVWPQRMEKIFADHEGIIKDKTDSYQEGLKQRRDRFQQDLESYQKQLEEFKSYAEPSEVQKYHQKAQKLQAKLDQALEKIEQFNAEEDAYGWDNSQYPLRQELQVRVFKHSWASPCIRLSTYDL